MLPTKFNFPAVYNPANQTKEELIANFVVRLKEFHSIFDIIKEDAMEMPSQHFIIQGLRGSGKTTLLLRLFHAVVDDKKLARFLIPVNFDEEQYNIRTLFKLWEQVALFLEEEHESLFHGLYDEMQKYIEREDYEEICFNLLEKRLKEKKKKLVLFIDNFGDMLAKFRRKERQRLREVLIQCSEIRIVGASSAVMEFQYDYSQPFFEFFRVFPLEGLKQKETIKLLLQLSKTYDAGTVEGIVKNNPGRVEALRRLSSGVPRTIILLFEIFLDHEKGDSFQDLEIILDRVTPLYKHRMDSLPPQKQDIVDAIALSWDAVGVKEIAKKTRIPSKAVSAHLNELEKNRIITKIPTSTKINLYQVSERFFNIWYLMRHGRKRERNKVLWLVRFLESWCSEDELVLRTLKHIKALKKGTAHEKHAYYMAEALASTKIPWDTQDQLLKETREYLSKKDSTLFKELSKSDQELNAEFEIHFIKDEFDLALKKLLEIKNKDYREHVFIAVLYFNIRRNKIEGLKFAKKAFEIRRDFVSNHFYLLALLWNNEIEKAVQMFNEFNEKGEIINLKGFMERILLLFLAKKQVYFVYKLFKENKFDIKDRYKPIYYALMHFMQDDYPDEYKKMGPELKQTVEEIIDRVNQMAIDYK